jgi:hypothetical protein
MTPGRGAPKPGKIIVAVDRDNKIIFVRKLDGNALKLLARYRSDGWQVVEIGTLKLMALPVQGTLLYCSPPFGADGKYVTAYHCVQGTRPAVVKCTGRGLDINVDVSVVESVPLRPWSWSCVLARGGCINYHDYAAVSDGLDGDMPQLVLSFGNERGDFAGYMPAPWYSDSPAGCRVRYTSYDYFDRRLVNIETKIAGRVLASVTGVDGRTYLMMAYYAHEPGRVLARPGYSGSNVYVM